MIERELEQTLATSKMCLLLLQNNWVKTPTQTNAEVSLQNRLTTYDRCISNCWEAKIFTLLQKKVVRCLTRIAEYHLPLNLL